MNNLLRANLAILCLVLSQRATAQIVVDVDDGIIFDNDSDRSLTTNGANLTLQTNDGEVVIKSTKPEVTTYFTGGLRLVGSPVRIFLGDSGSNDGKFEIWPLNGVPGSGTPLFSIDSSADTAVFSGLNVSIASGTLSVGGTPVVTTSYLSSNNYLQKKSSDATWLHAGGILAQGPYAQASTGSIAIGENAQAFGPSSVALGMYSIVNSGGSESVALNGGQAEGPYSVATSYGIASGSLSIAMASAFADGDSSIGIGGYDWAYPEGGNHSIAECSVTLGGVMNVASGFSSFAAGYKTVAGSAYSTAIGSMNSATSGSANSWVETDILFDLGNGTVARGAPWTSTDRSSAVKVLKNGETTLTNKAWKLNVAGTGDPLEDPPATTTDSAGRALVVEGHTELKGKVIIAEPQGDISMGIFQ